VAARFMSIITSITGHLGSFGHFLQFAKMTNRVKVPSSLRVLQHPSGYTRETAPGKAACRVRDQPHPNQRNRGNGVRLKDMALLLARR